VVYTIFMSLLGLAPSVLWIFTLLFALAEMTSAIQTLRYVGPEPAPAPATS